MSGSHDTAWQSRRAAFDRSHDGHATTALLVLWVALEHPGSTDPQIADLCGIKVDTTRARRVDLVDAGLVEAGGHDGRYTTWGATADGVRVMELSDPATAIADRVAAARARRAAMPRPDEALAELVDAVEGVEICADLFEAQRLNDALDQARKVLCR